MNYFLFCFVIALGLGVGLIVVLLLVGLLRNNMFVIFHRYDLRILSLAFLGYVLSIMC